MVDLARKPLSPPSGSRPRRPCRPPRECAISDFTTGTYTGSGASHQAAAEDRLQFAPPLRRLGVAQRPVLPMGVGPCTRPARRPRPRGVDGHEAFTQPAQHQRRCATASCTIPVAQPGRWARSSPPDTLLRLLRCIVRDVVVLVGLRIQTGLRVLKQHQSAHVSGFERGRRVASTVAPMSTGLRPGAPGAGRWCTVARVASEKPAQRRRLRPRRTPRPRRAPGDGNAPAYRPAPCHHRAFERSDLVRSAMAMSQERKKLFEGVLAAD